MKICIKCRIEKNESCFYHNKNRKDGLQSWCKDCGLKWYRVYSKTDKHLEYRRKRSQTKEQREKVKEYFKNPKNKERYNAWQRNNRKNKLEKMKNYCRSLTHHYINMGKIKKENCRDCNSIKSEIHHFNYDSPYNIVWLCKKCHAKEHRLLNKVKEGSLV